MPKLQFIRCGSCCLIAAIICLSSGCGTNEAEVNELYGLNEPGNPFIDTTGDLKDGLALLKSGDAAQAYEQLGKMPEAYFPGAEEIVAELNKNFDSLATGKPLEGGSKATSKDVQELLKKLIAHEVARQKAAEPAGAEA